MTRTTNIIALLSTLLFVLSCQDDLENDLIEIPEPAPVFMDLSQDTIPSQLMEERGLQMLQFTWLNI